MAKAIASTTAHQIVLTQALFALAECRFRHAPLIRRVCCLHLPAMAARVGASFSVASPAAECQMEKKMTRTLALFAAAATLAGTLIASATPSLAQERGSRWVAQQNYFGPGQYDRLVNGSDASTPGHN